MDVSNLFPSSQPAMMRQYDDHLTTPESMMKGNGQTRSGPLFGGEMSPSDDKKHVDGLDMVYLAGVHYGGCALDNGNWELC